MFDIKAQCFGRKETTSQVQGFISSLLFCSSTIQSHILHYRNKKGDIKNEIFLKIKFIFISSFMLPSGPPSCLFLNLPIPALALPDKAASPNHFFPNQTDPPAHTDTDT